MLGVEGAQCHINMLWRYNQGTLLYLSSGAGRGVELTRVHSFEHFQEHFNCLRFQMRSEKNVLHGVDNNQQVPHFVPATLSRPIIIANMVVYPAATASQTLTVPSVAEGPAEAALKKLVILADNRKKIRLSASFVRLSARGLADNHLSATAS